MSRPVERLLEVELLEDGLEPGPDDRGARQDAPPPAARVRRRGWWAAAAGLVALAVTGTDVVDHVRDARLDHRLAGVAGLSAALDRPLIEAWRVPGTGVAGVIGATVLVRAAGTRGVLGVDPATGTVRWSREGACEQVPVGPATGDPASGEPASIDRASVDATATDRGLTDRPDDLVLCVEQLSTGGVDDGHVLPLAAHVLDPATGVVLRTIDLGPRTSYATVGSDVVTLGIAEDGHAEAARWSLLTGEQRWAYRSPEMLPPTDGWGSSIDATVVQLDLGPWTLTLDAGSGRRIPRIPPRELVREPTWGPLRLADGATAVSRPDAARSAETVVRERDGSTRATVPGLLVLPTLDDGSVPDRLYVVRGDDPARPLQIAGIDPATGATRWTVTTPTGRAAVVQGLLLVRDDGGVTALDARTGTLRWTSTADDAPRSGGSLVSDGRRVLIVEGVPRNPRLVARDVVSGEVVWSGPHPGDGAAPALLPDGTVVAVGSGELVALRPPGR